ncbi:MAG: acetyltransferase [Clostridia bacterium]|nr:acetyltransferase [Clostridia bacterium]
MKNVVIIGSGGHGKVVADIVKANGDNIVGFLDDFEKSEMTIGRISDYQKCCDDVEFIIAIGDTQDRERISKSMDCRWYTAIHPTAVVSPNATVGEGTVVAPNAVINSGAVVGKHCIVNTGAIVEHENIIGDFCHISVGTRLGGNVKIGDSAFIGIGAIVKNNINICENCIVGAGAVVVDDLTESGTYIGVPARKKD